MCRMFNFNSSVFPTPSRSSPAHSFFVIGAGIFVAAGSIFSFPILTCSADFYKTFLLLRENGNPVRLSIPRGSVFLPDPPDHPSTKFLPFLSVYPRSYFFGTLARSQLFSGLCSYFFRGNRFSCYAFVPAYFYFFLSYMYVCM